MCSRKAVVNGLRETSLSRATVSGALAKAMKSARDTADALAKAAHVSILDIQSISNSTDSSGMPMNRGAMLMSSAPVLPGTDAVNRYLLDPWAKFVSRGVSKHDTGEPVDKPRGRKAAYA